MTLRFNKRSLIASVILLIVAVIYSVIFFVVPFPDISETAFNVSYGFTLGSLLLSIIIFIIAFGGNKNLNVRIISVPIIYVAYSLVFAQFLFDIVLMWVGSFIEFKTWIVIVFETIIFGISLIFLILKTSYRNMILKNDTKTSSKESFIKELRIEINSITNENKNELLSKELHKLDELIKYTTPVSNNDVLDLENRIIDLINSLKISSNTEDSLKIISDITNLLKERKIRLQK